MHKRFLGGSIGRAGLVIDWIWGAVGRGVDTDNIQVFIWSAVDMVVPLTRKRILRKGLGLGHKMLNSISTCFNPVPGHISPD